MAHKRKVKHHRKHRVHHRRRKHNPANPVYKARGVLNRRHRRRSRRRYHNPEFSLSTTSLTNVAIDGAVAAGGGVSAAWLSNMFGIEGNMKYLFQIGYGLLGGFLLQKLNTGIAKPFALGVLAVTAYQFAQDKQLLEGLGLGSLGNSNEMSLQDWQNLENIKRAFQTENVNGLGLIPETTQGLIPLNGADSYEYADAGMY